MYIGLSKTTTDNLQLVQNAAVRGLIQAKMREHIRPVLVASLFHLEWMKN